MSGIVLWSVLLGAATTAVEPVSYDEAYEAAQKSRKPMLILVGADWCPACRVMKYTTMPQLLKEGKLTKVSYTLVDVDQFPQRSSQLMQSRSIPQLVLCIPDEAGWKRVYLHGSQSAQAVAAMVQQSLPKVSRPATEERGAE